MSRDQFQIFADNSVGLQFQPMSCWVYRIQQKISSIHVGFTWFEITPMKISSVYRFEI